MVGKKRLIPVCLVLGICGVLGLVVAVLVLDDGIKVKSEPPPDASPTLEDWKEGESVYLTGVLWQSHLGEHFSHPELHGRYCMRRSSHVCDYAFLASPGIDRLAKATKVWVRGTVRYATYEKWPRFKHCYIVVSEFEEREGAFQDIVASFKMEALRKDRAEEGAYLIKHIKPGMSRGQVWDLLGAPDNCHKRFPHEAWWYETFCSRCIDVRFKFFRVVDVHGG
jgi:hypothetical protein